MATDEQLGAIRARIDAIDTQLLELISERAKCAQEVAAVKLEASRLVAEEAPLFYRPEREAQVLRAIQDRNSGPLPSDYVARIFREIMSSCLALEQPLTVAYLGPPGPIPKPLLASTLVSRRFRKPTNRLRLFFGR